MENLTSLSVGASRPLQTLAGASQRRCKDPKRYTGPPTGHPLHMLSLSHMQYVENGVWCDDEGLPGLDMGGARGAVYEVAAAASDHEAERQNTGQEYKEYGQSSL